MQAIPKLLGALGGATAGTAATGAQIAAGTAVAAGTAASVAGAVTAGKTPKITPMGSPTIDMAAKNTAQMDRIQRRKGVLANLYGGTKQTGAGPAVAQKTLLGQ